MTIDEQELRRRLEETAAQVGVPRFTAVDLTRQIQRRRARVIRAVVGAAVVATAIAVAFPVMLSGNGQPVVSRPVALPPPPPFSVTVNGQTRPVPARYVISPGEDLTIILDVTIPAHEPLSALWIGITNGLLTSGPNGPDMSPVLAADTGTILSPGTHQFRLHWVIPSGMRAGASRQLSVEWLWSHPAEPGAGGERIIAELRVPGASET